jgi:hypothetical protein
MKTIMAGVGVVQLFDPSTEALISTSKTLTESAINMAVTAEEARGGQGNVLLGKYYHDTSFGLTLTDQLFDLNYLALNCGGAITAGSDVIKNEQVTVGAGGVITVSETPVAFPTTENIVGWYKKPNDGDDAYVKIDFTGKNATVSEALVGQDVCVKYFYNSATARKFTVSATFIPSIVHAVMTIPLFKAGTDASALSSSSQIGQLVVDIPNFQLNGAQDLSLTSGGIATTALSGSALATFGGAEGCDGHGYYAVITEEIFNKAWYENVFALVIDDSDIDLKNDETQKINVYALYSDGTAPNKVDPSKLTFTADGTSATVDANGVVTADSSEVGQTIIEVVANDKQTLVAKAVVTVTSA